MPDFTTLTQNWYRLNKRDLPWRTEISPYKVWISEIILQQTQVVQGLDYYHKFIKQFPTVKDLANASEQEVLKLWQGLGYYSRARNMHFASKQIVNEFNGEFPSTYEGLIKLKGVGEYTASAISSIAFNLPFAVVDGNVFRVLSRVFEMDIPINTNQGKKEFTILATKLIDKTNPGDHNQALMEIGALVCKPKNPDCINCPLQSKCLAFKHSTQLDLPVKLKKLKVKNITLNYLVVTNGESVVVKKRGKNDIWQGLYDFPIDDEVGDKYPLDCEMKHVLTHRKIQAKFWIVPFDHYQLKDDEMIIKITEFDEYPIPQLLVKYFKQSDYFK